ncbi:MAG: hypothetical protein ACE37F_14750 [Nannocystaceae bacterium]|nr:hypothetical protein [bacterium]
MVRTAPARRLQLLVSSLFVMLALFSSNRAFAADPEPAELRQVVETALPEPDFAPSPAIGLRWARDMEWTVLALTDPWELREGASLLARGPLPGLERFDVRRDGWQATPYAATTVASAFAALATRGIPVFREQRDAKTIRTHRLGCYFKGRGGGLVWRLEF